MDVLRTRPLGGVVEHVDAELLEVVPGAGVLPDAHQVRRGNALVDAATGAPGAGQRVAGSLGGARQVELRQEVAAIELDDDEPLGQVVLTAQLDGSLEQDARLVRATQRE